MLSNILKKDFPILKRKINGHQLVYLDSAATALKPKMMIDAVRDYYENYTANIHRGIHTLAEEATVKFEETRNLVKELIGASDRCEIIFTSGATMSLNMIASMLGSTMKPGDEIILSEAEHHSNIVPWQQVAKARQAQIKYVPLTDDGRLDFNEYKKLLSRKAKIVSLNHASNVTGAITPLKKFFTLAKKYQAYTVADAAQSAPHIPIKVRELACDFLVASGHKMLGPTGVGFLYGRKQLLDILPPPLTGGHMIKKVNKHETTFAEPPQKFEAGTQPIAQVIGLGAAIKYLKKLGMTNIAAHEKKLTKYALSEFHKIPQVTLLGPQSSTNRLAVFSFYIEGVPAHDIASLLDAEGIEVRSGHHCTHILHSHYGIPASTRISPYLYNDLAEHKKFFSALKKIIRLFS